MAAEKTWKGTATTLVEVPDSPTYELGEKVLQVRSYVGLHSLCVSEAFRAYQKGTIGMGDQTGYSVQKSTVSRSRGDQGLLVVTWESNGVESGQTLPPEEYSVTPENQNPRVERHAAFDALKGETVTFVDTRPGYSGTKTIPLLTAIQNAAFSQDSRTFWAEVIATADEATTALKLLGKLEGGLESYYLCALRYAWVTHSWACPTVDRGGYPQTPLGPLAGYFSADIDWLRESDDLQFQNGIYRLTQSWSGGPESEWDADLYPPLE